MYSSPLWYARFVPDLADRIGPHDPSMAGPVRLDGALRDGDGGVYWLLAAALPGFDSFRFPAKFLTIAALGIAGLAGIGWDRLAAGGRGRGRVIAIAAAALVATLGVGMALGLQSGRFESWIAAHPMAEAGGMFGPIDPRGSLRAAARGLGHGAAAMAAVIALAMIAPRRPRLAATLAVAALAVDLGVANARFVLTVPQELLDEENTPRVVELIAEAEAEAPADGPYRVHRMPVWNPLAWRMHGAADRVDDLVRWERGTIQPKYGLPQRRRVHAHRGDGRALRHALLLRPLRADPPGRGGGDAQGRVRRQGGDLPPTRVRPLEHEVLRPPDPPPRRLGRRAPGLRGLPARDDADLPRPPGRWRR